MVKHKMRLRYMGVSTIYAVSNKRPPGRSRGVPVEIPPEWRNALRSWLESEGRGAQRALSAAIGTSPVTISEIVRGRRSASLEVVRAISAQTGIGLPAPRTDPITKRLILAVERARAAGLSEDRLLSLARGIEEAASKMEKAAKAQADAQAAMDSFLKAAQAKD